MSERESPLNVRNGTGKHRHILQESPVRLNVKRQSSHLKFYVRLCYRTGAQFLWDATALMEKAIMSLNFGAKLEAAK